MQATIDRLHADLTQSRTEMAETRAQPSVDLVVAAPTSVMVEKAPHSPLSGDLLEALREIVREENLKERFFIRACLEDIEPRLNPAPALRPPLAADRKKAAVVKKAGTSTSEAAKPGQSKAAKTAPATATSYAAKAA